MEKNATKKKRQEMAAILPQEIWHLILSFTEHPEDAVAWSLVSKQFNHYIMNDDLLRKRVEKYKFLHKIATIPIENNTVVIAIAGAGSVGKSASWLKFTLPDQPADDYDPTIEDFDHVKVTIDGEEYTALIVDFGSGDMDDTIQFFKSRVHGVYLVYDITSQEGLTNAGQFLRSIQTWKNAANFPLLVAGNKLDLAERQLRAITPKAGQDFANANNALFFETSARDGRNISEAFMALIRYTIEVHNHSTRRAKVLLKDAAKKNCLVM